MTISFGDHTRTRLRTLVQTIDTELARTTDAASTELRALWTELVAALALGPAPDLRTCPACGGLGMRAASRCGNCWAALVPISAGK
jgi:hypothetical protein